MDAREFNFGGDRYFRQLPDAAFEASYEDLYGDTVKVISYNGNSVLLEVTEGKKVATVDLETSVARALAGYILDNTGGR